MSQADLFSERKGLHEICHVPDRIISVYSLEKHVWANANAEASRRGRTPELQTVEEFQIDPVRPFFTDILRNMAAPWKRERKDQPVGQGYWIQAEFGSGKSHLLCCLAALALGQKAAWDIVQQKEVAAGRGRRESLYRFWEEGIGAGGQKGRGIFVMVKTLVGAGSGTVGLADKGRRLSEYILDAAREQLQIELGKNISLYPVELLADRFIREDVERYRKDLSRFLHDARFFEADECEAVDDFIHTIQQDQSPEYKRSCGNKLWRFYTEYLKVQPQIAAETEDILQHLVETILAEGYRGVLLVLDEVSLFMKNRPEDQRIEDEKTLVVLSNRLAKIHNLPVWTVCAAQQAIESRMGVKNIIADDRLKLVKLLEADQDYYNIVLARVRRIQQPAAISSYYLHYKRGFTWPDSMGEADFNHFFPFHKPAIEVLRAITYELTTTRSAIHFMHQTLKHQIKHQGRELIRLWELFDEAVRYEEDPSGVHAGLVAIKTRREQDYRAYEACRRQIDGLTRGFLKVYRDKAIKVIQTLFLYHIAHTRQQGLTPEDLANSVLMERSDDAHPDENIQHYETLAANLKKELRQIVQTFDEGGRPLYRFDPVFTGVDPRNAFSRARDEAEANEALQREAWEHLLGLDKWPVQTRQMTIDLSGEVRSVFREMAPFVTSDKHQRTPRAGNVPLELVWQGRQISGRVGMRDFGRLVADQQPLPPIDSDQTDLDFAVYVSSRPATPATVMTLLKRRKDPRMILWTPAELTGEERDRLLDFAACRKLVADWQGKETEDAVAAINWVADTLQTDLGRMVKIVDSSYGRGRVDALNNTQMTFHVAGELTAILTPLVERVLTATYTSRDIRFEPPFVFRREEGVKVINGIVKTGRIPPGAKPNQNISAARNFGFGLNIMKKSAEKELDTTGNPYVQDLWHFIEDKLTDDGQTMKVETLYKNFMGIGGPKDYGLTRRMVQIFLLCLVREGRVRVTVGPKAGLAVPVLDYANLAEVEFSSKVLDALGEVQKVAQPENWDILRPYAEKLLGEDIPAVPFGVQHDALISRQREKLRHLFVREKDVAAQTLARAQSLFEALKTPNPYATELTQIATLFGTTVEGGNDIQLLLYALKTALGYQAFDTGTVSPAEVDDLARRLKHYRDLRAFLEYDRELRTAQAYCTVSLGDHPELADIRSAVAAVQFRMAHLQDYIDSEVRLKTELVGRFPPVEGEKGTIAALIQIYTARYLPVHESTLNQVETRRRQIQKVLQGADLRVLSLLEGITALQPAGTNTLVARLKQLETEMFTCSAPSRASVEDHLRQSPQHECGLTFTNVATHLHQADAAAQEAVQLLDQAFEQKMTVFLTPAVRERLQQAQSQPFLARLLACTTPAGLRAAFIQAAEEIPNLVELINTCLRRIQVKRVRMADFRPATGTIQRNQIREVAKAFERFLESQFMDMDTDTVKEEEGDVLPVLQLE